jgi:transposase
MTSQLPITFPHRGHPVGTRSKILRHLLLGQEPHDVADTCNVALRTVYNYRTNLLLYGSTRGPCIRQLGRPRKLTVADEDAILDLLLREGWRERSEIAFWVWCERGILVSRWCIGRMLKRKKWTQKELQRVSLARSGELRDAWREEMRIFAAEDIVFLDESIFNEKTGW